MEQNKTAIIIGHNPSTNLGLVRALSVRGYLSHVVIIKPLSNSNIERYSRYVKSISYINIGDTENAVRSLVEKFSCKGIRPVIFATNDKAIYFLCKNRELLSPYFNIPTFKDDQYDIDVLLDKMVQKQMAVDSGFKTVKGWSVDLRNNEFEVPDDIEYPCYVKGQRGICTPKRFQKKCLTREELIQHLSIIKNESPSLVIVEKFANIDCECGMMAFCDGDRILAPCLVDFTVMGKGARPGVSMQGVVHPIEESSSLYKHVITFFKKLNYHGLCNIDLFRSDDEYYFVELNVRYAAYCYAVSKSGVNLPGLFADSFESNYNINNIPKAKKIVYLNENSAMDNVLEHNISWIDYLKMTRRADATFIYNSNDKLPYYYFIYHSLKRYIKTLF